MAAVSQWWVSASVPGLSVAPCNFRWRQWWPLSPCILCVCSLRATWQGLQLVHSREATWAKPECTWSKKQWLGSSLQEYRERELRKCRAVKAEASLMPLWDLCLQGFRIPQILKSLQGHGAIILMHGTSSFLSVLIPLANGCLATRLFALLKILYHSLQDQLRFPNFSNLLLFNYKFHL